MFLKTTLPMVIALGLVLAGTPAPAHEIGFFFDTQGTITQVSTTVPDEVVTAYLILKPKPRGDRLGGFEGFFSYQTSGEDPTFDWQLKYGGVNWHSIPRFLVATTEGPWVLGQDLVLAAVAITVPEPGQQIDLQFLANPTPTLQEPLGYPVFMPQIGLWSGLIETADSTGDCLSVASASINRQHPQHIAVEFANTGDFGNVPGNQPSFRDVKIRNRSKQTVAGSLTIEGDGFRLRHGDGGYVPAPTWVTLQPDEEKTISVRYTPHGVDHSFGQINFSSCGIVAAIPLAAHEDTDPIITWSPAAAAFGPMYPGWAKTREITATNHSGSPVLVDLSPTNDAFSLEPADLQFTLQPGASRTVAITCEPAYTGAVFGRIACSNPDLPSLPTLAFCHDFTPECNYVWLDGGTGDFGQVTPGYPKWRTVEIVNTSPTETLSGTIRLTGTKTGFNIERGGGTVSLAPGKSHLVQIVANPARAGNPVDTMISLGECPFVTMRMTAVNPVRDLTVDPEYVAFGDVAVNHLARINVTLRNTGTIPVTGIQMSLQGDAEFTYSAASTNTYLFPGQRLDVQITYAPTSVGGHDATFSFGLYDVPPVAITGTARLPMAICLVPDDYDFGTVEVGVPEQKEMIIRNQGELDLEIDVSIVSDVFTIVSGGGAHTIAPSSMHAFVVEAAPQESGVVSAVIETGTEECEDIAVTVTGFTGIVGEFTPTALDFGFQYIGQSAQLPLTLTNVSDVTLTAIRLQTAPPFMVTPSRITSLAPGATANLIVGVSSQDTGEFNGQITTNYSGCGPVPLTVQFLDEGDGDKSLPGATALLGCMPNPFNPSTDVRYELACDSKVELSVYDVSGRHIADLVSEHQPAGTHVVTWDGRNASGQMAPSGVYYFRLKTTDGEFMQKASLLK